MSAGGRKTVIKVYLGSPFQPRVRLGATVFKALVKLRGVEYRRGEGFVINDYSAIPRVNALLDRFNVILVPYGRCAICGRDVRCETCEYRDGCRKDVDICICRSCLEKGDVWRSYVASQRKLVSPPPTSR